MACNHGDTIRDRAITLLLQGVGLVASLIALVQSSQSLALIAEFWHFVSDTLPGMIGFGVAVELHRRKYHGPRHWGYLVATVVNAWSMVVAGLWSWYEVLVANWHNHRVVQYDVAIPVAVLCFGCNAIGAWRAYVHRDRAKDFWEYGKHLLADSVLSLFILASIIAASLWHYTFIDSFGAIVVGAWMLWYGLTSHQAGLAAYRLRKKYYKKYRHPPYR